MLPGPYERWFREICGRPSPVETRSTCDHCAMDPGAPELPPEGPFDPALRCCTYHPHLAPHFVGGILAAGSDLGRARVRARIAARTGVTPLGLGPTPAFSASYQQALARPGAFGREPVALCPFLDAGRCSIWQHRGAPCASFHCKLDRGVVSAELWRFLTVACNAIERSLARWLLARQGLAVSLCDALLHAPEDAEADARAWGAWRGREEAYFLEAARLVEALSWPEVAALGGRELAGLDDALRVTAARLEAAPPERVRAGEVLYQLGRPGRARYLHPALPLDPLEIPAELAARLAGLSDSGLAELGLEPALARRLLDWQVLVPALPGA